MLKSKMRSIYDKGVLVVSVTPGGPAAGAGIRRGTIILSVEGQAANTADELSNLLTLEGVGASVTLTVLNGDAPEEITLTLADGPPLLGVQLAGNVDGSGLGRIPGTGEPFGGPGQFQFDPDNLPFDPGEFGFDMAGVQGGVLVAEVIKGSAAELSGLEAGDVIESINGEPVDSMEQLIEQVGAMKPGATVVLTIRRNGETKEYSLVLGAHPDDATRGFMGVNLAPLMGEPGRKGSFGIPFGGEMPTGGAVVVEVEENSPAALAGLQAGDIVESADGQPVETVDHLVQILGEKSPGDSVTFSIARDGQSLDIEAILGERTDDASRAYLGVQLGAFFNVDVGRLGDDYQGTLPEEFFFHLQPDFNPGDFPELPPDLEQLLPDFDNGSKVQPELQEQDA